MIQFYQRPDPLIDPLPKAIRAAYYAVESSLMAADSVALMIAANRADLLPQPIGSLQARMPENKAAANAIEAELAAVRKFSAFSAMGQAYPTAHSAALDYCEKIARAVNCAAQSTEFYLVDAWGQEGEIPWAQAATTHLLNHDVIAVEGEATRPGPKGGTFRERFRQLQPNAQTQDLQTGMRLELAAWAQEQKATQGVGTHLPDSTAGEEWLPAVEAVKRAQLANLQVDLPWLSRSAEKNGVKVRPRQLLGRHQREVEWNSPVGYLARRKSAGATADWEDDPSPSEQQKIENRKQKADGKKRRERPTD